jgi:hypothetical protein
MFKENNMFKKSMKTLILVIVIIAISGFTFAFAAANTVGNTKAGEGSGTVTGYAVSSVVYTLNATTPGNIDSVAFTLDTAAALVKIRLVSSTGPWYTCSAGGTTITCATTSPQATVLGTDTLQVVAASN